MTTVKNRTERAKETREEKRARLASPELAAKAEEHRAAQAANQTFQAGLAAARENMRQNMRRQLDGEIVALRRMSDRAQLGYTDAARAGYIRVYERMMRLAQAIADDFGEPVSVPAYDPPTDPLPANAVTIKPRSAEARAADHTYRETLGLGPSGKGGPLPGYPGSDADLAWLNVQGGKP